MLVTVDLHVAGQPVRLITSGWPECRGTTMIEKRESVQSTQDHLRRLLMHEPRGHVDMCGVLLTAAERDDSDAGLLFMNHSGFPAMNGAGIVAAARHVAERSGDRARFVTFDTPAGQVRCRVHWSKGSDGPLVQRVSFASVPSFVLAAGVPVTVGNRVLNVDVAYSGVFHAIVDAESAGRAVTIDKLNELRVAGAAIAKAVEKELSVVHPTQPELSGLDGVVFTGPPTSELAGLRSVTVFADQAIDRSPCGTGTCALVSVLDAMGLVDAEQPFVHEGLLSTTFTGAVVERTMVGELPAVVVEVSGSAWRTGDHTFALESGDPFPQGYELGVNDRDLPR